MISERILKALRDARLKTASMGNPNGELEFALANLVAAAEKISARSVNCDWLPICRCENSNVKFAIKALDLALREVE